MERSEFYINNQDIVNILSLYIKSSSDEDFTIHWNNVRTSMGKNCHYKFLKKMEEEAGYTTEELNEDIINSLKVKEEDLRNIQKHFMLLQLEEIQKVYIPYIPDAIKWSNIQKQFILHEIKTNKAEYSPRGIINMLKMCNCK